MEATERRVVIQDWYETEYGKTGWDSHGWKFLDDNQDIDGWEWEVVEIVDMDKYGNPLVGISEKQTEIN